MVMFNIDRNAHEILKKVKQEMRKQGIKADFSDTIRYLYQYFQQNKGAKN